MKFDPVTEAMSAKNTAAAAEAEALIAQISLTAQTLKNEAAEYDAIIGAANEDLIAAADRLISQAVKLRAQLSLIDAYHNATLTAHSIDNELNG